MRLITLLSLSFLATGARAQENWGAATTSKAARLEIVPLAFATLTDRWVNHSGAGLAVAFHFHDLVGVELFASIPGAMTGGYTDVVEDVYNYESLTPSVVNLKQIDFVAGLAAQLSPLWGEGDLYGIQLGYHLYVVAGAGLVRTLEPCYPNQGDCGEDIGIGRGLQRPEDNAEANRVAGHLGFGLRLSFTDLLGARFEVRDVIFNDTAEEFGYVDEELKHNIMLIAGISFLL